MNSVRAIVPVEAVPALRRAYFDCRYGQLHVYQAIPAGGGFDERTTLLCLPAPGDSAVVFQPLLEVLGGARSVFAIDLPGSGMSDGAAPAMTDAARADGVMDFLQGMRIRRADVLADGAAAGVVAALLPAATGRVARVVLCGADPHSLTGLAPAAVDLHLIGENVGELTAGELTARSQGQRLREILDSGAR